MAVYYYLAKDRGRIDTGWLTSYYSFNFETMDQFEKIRFGQLRILNNDTIRGGTGFGTHSHENMEIVTIPLSGGLVHKDSLGNEHRLVPGDVQVMTAGTGIRHSEYNLYAERDTNFLQIWVFPVKNGLAPRYDQRLFDPRNRENRWDLVVAPKGLAPLSISQSAYFSRVSLDAGKSVAYNLYETNDGVLLYVISGEIQVENETFKRGDAVGFKDLSKIRVEANKVAEVLAIEVPFNK